VTDFSKRRKTGARPLRLGARVYGTDKQLNPLKIFEALLTNAPETAHEKLFPAAARAG